MLQAPILPHFPPFGIFLITPLFIIEACMEFRNHFKRAFILWFDRSLFSRIRTWGY